MVQDGSRRLSLESVVMAGMACIATANDCSLVQCCRLCDRSQMAGLGRRRSLASRPDVLRMFFL